MLKAEQVEATAAWIATQQKRSGEIPWWRGGKTDPWDHVHAAMGLTVAGRLDETRLAYRFLARTQTESGAWPAQRKRGRTSDSTRESNHAAYFATGLWQLHLAADDSDFLREMWPTLERAVEFTLGLQEADGTVSWAVAPSGRPWRAPLLAGCSSIHGSVVCAIRIAEQLGYDRSDWRVARERLGDALRDQPDAFSAADLPEAPGSDSRSPGYSRYSMDWYYPVLGGAVREKQGRERLLDKLWQSSFLVEGVGCRCVDDSPWHTVAETCELALALDAAGLHSRAQQVLSWMFQYRREDGAYWTGKTYPENVFWPVEANTWTAATVLIANDALARSSATSGLFRSLEGDDLSESDRAVAS